MTPRRWDVAWAGLDPTLGHEQAGRRPVLVVSNDVVSAGIGLVAIVPLTTFRQGRRVYPTEVLIPAGGSGLQAASLVLCHLVRTVSADRLSPSVGRLDEPGLRAAVERALHLWLDLAS